MVADDFQGRLCPLIRGPVLHARQVSRRLHKREDEVRLIVVGHALQDLGDALQAHARVNVLGRERGEHPFRRPVGLHEDQVIKLDEPRVVARNVRPGHPALRVEIVVQFGAGAAGAGRPRRPEIVFRAAPLDTFGRDADDFRPQAGRLVVVLVYRHPDAVGRDAQPHGRKLPGHADGVLLEIVAERKVAQHLEEGVVPGRHTHVLDVVGANAFLGGRRPRVAAWGLAQEDGLELEHAGDGEQDSRVVWDERCRREAGVPLLLVETQESVPDFGTRERWGRAGRGYALCR